MTKEKTITCNTDKLIIKPKRKYVEITAVIDQTGETFNINKKELIKFLRG